MRRCSVAIVIWIALFAGYSYYLYRAGLPIEGAFLGGALMSFLVGLGLAMLNGSRYALRERGAMERFRRGERPQDGEIAMISGEIRPVFEPLHAPFTGRECVVYRYDLGPRSRGDRKVAREYAGFAFARCAIYTPYGSYALGSFPVMEGFAEQPGDAARAQEYVAATQFEELSNVLALAKVTLDLHQHPPPLRIDWQFGRPAEGEKVAKELIVESGATVTAYGRYSSAMNGLVAGDKEKGYLRLFAGKKSGISAGALSQLITGAVLIVVANVGMWLVLSNLPRL